MPNEPLDWMDVQAIAAKGDNEERAARCRHIEDVARDLRAEFRREVMELREDIAAVMIETQGRSEARS